MASINFTTEELVNIGKHYLPDEIDNLKGTSTGFDFEVKINHGIPLVPTIIPLKLDYRGFEEDTLYFELSVNTDNKLIQKVTSKIIKIFSSGFEKYFPAGIYMDANYIYVDINKLSGGSGMKIKITDVSFAESNVHIEFDLHLHESNV